MLPNPGLRLRLHPGLYSIARIRGLVSCKYLGNDKALKACPYPDICTKNAFSSPRSDGVNLAVRFNARKASKTPPRRVSDG
jgi:hypothetical protein